MNDRRLHALTSDGTEIVRYDLAGKWYAERPGLDWRKPLRFRDVVRIAGHASAHVTYGVPGGSRFDAAVKPLRGDA